MPLTIATQQVFDYEYATGDPTLTTAQPLVGMTVQCQLLYNLVNAVSPAANLQPVLMQTTTDANGRWQFNLVPNTNINPANTTYLITTPTKRYEISVGNAGPYQSTAIMVNQPTSLAPTASSVGALTVTGAFTVNTGPVSLPAGSISVADLQGVLPILNGGTGSSTKNFVDLSNAQTVGGAKTFNGALTATAGLTVSGGSTINGLTVQSGSISLTSLIVQALAGQTADLQEWSNSSGTVLARIDASGNLTAVAATFGGHVVVTGGTPTLGALQSGVASQSVSGNDTRGSVTFTTVASGTSVAAGGSVAVINFAAAYGVAPIVAVTAANGHSTAFAVQSVTTIGFTIYSQFGSSLPLNYTDIINYVVMG